MQMGIRHLSFPIWKQQHLSVPSHMSSWEARDDASGIERSKGTSSCLFTFPQVSFLLREMGSDGLRCGPSIPKGENPAHQQLLAASPFCFPLIMINMSKVIWAQMQSLPHDRSARGAIIVKRYWQRLRFLDVFVSRGSIGDLSVKAMSHWNSTCNASLSATPHCTCTLSFSAPP